MSHPTGAAGAAPTDLGVVDPIRIPGLGPARGIWLRLPALAKLFVALAILDYPLRLLHVGGLSSFIDLEVPITILWGATHTAIVLLPAVLLLRQPNAPTAVPLIVRGAIAVALVELLSDYAALVSPDFAANLDLWTVLRLVMAAARTAGYLAIGIGLVRLSRAEQAPPTPTIAGLANLVAASIAAPVVVGLVTQVLRPSGSPFPGIDIANIAFGASVIALAFLARAIVRGTEDVLRPRIARTLATAGAVLIAVDSVVMTALGLVVLYNQVVDPSFTLPNGQYGLGWFGTGLGLLLLVVAFGLGLADASGRMRRLDGEPQDAAAPEPASVQWPAPGGDVPAFHEESKA